MLTLEYSTPRAGDIESLFKNSSLDEKITLGLGVINPRNSIIENVSDIVSSAEQALKFLPPERIWLNPDCGFATFSSRPLNDYSIIKQKMKVLSKAATILRSKYC